MPRSKTTRKGKHAAPQIHYQAIKIETLEFYDQFNGIQRADPVAITIETMQCPAARTPEFMRPVHVIGKVIPTPTKGRPNAPEPACGVAVSTSKSGVSYHWGGLERNEGLADMQKGHIMALELGGPDHPFNIVPQWAMWQSNGDWREFEKRVHRLASHTPRELVFECHLVYQEGSFKRSGTPVGFYVEIHDRGHIIDKFQHEQFQTETDDFIFFRDALDIEDGEAPDLMEWKKKGKGRVLKQKKPSRLSKKEKLIESVLHDFQKQKRTGGVKKPTAIFPGVRYIGVKDRKKQEELLKRAMLDLKRLKRQQPAVIDFDSSFYDAEDRNDLDYAAESSSDSESSMEL